MGRLEALEEVVENAREQISLAESLAKALGDNVAEVISTITGLS